MRVTGGPFDPNVGTLDKLRNLAGAAARGHFRKLNSEVRRAREEIQTSPPVRRDPGERQKQPEPATPDHEFSPIITGLHDKSKRRSQKFPANTPSGQGFGGLAVQGGVGAHKT